MYCLYRDGPICVMLIVSLLMLVICNVHCGIQLPSWCLIITNCTNVIVSGTIPAALFYLMAESWTVVKVRQFNLDIIRDNLHEINSLCLDLCDAFCSSLCKKDENYYSIKEADWKNLQLYCSQIKSKYMEILSLSTVLSLKDRQNLHIQTSNQFYRYVYHVADNKYILNEVFNSNKLRILKDSNQSFLEFIKSFSHKLEI